MVNPMMRFAFMGLRQANKLHLEEIAAMKTTKHLHYITHQHTSEIINSIFQQVLYIFH